MGRRLRSADRLMVVTLLAALIAVTVHALTGPIPAAANEPALNDATADDAISANDAGSTRYASESPDTSDPSFSGACADAPRGCSPTFHLPTIMPPASTAPHGGA